MMDLMSAFSSLQLWLVGIITFLVAYNNLTKIQWRRLPPGPPALPLVGSLPFLGKDVRKPLLKMAAKYGDVFTIHLGLQPAIVLNGYDTIKEALVKNSHVFSGRGANPVMDIWSGGYGIIFANGTVWQEQRHFVLQVMRQFGVGRSVFEAKILEEISFFTQELSKQNGKPFNPRSLLCQSLCNVIASVTCDKRYDYGDNEVKMILRVMDAITAAAQASGLLNILPFMRYLPGDLMGFNALQRGIDELRYHIHEIIEQHKLTYKEHHESRDMIDAYLKKMDAESGCDDTSFSDNQLIGAVQDLYGAGTETTATTLSWAIIYMTLNPDIQSRVQAEIDDVITTDVDITMDQKRRLPYTEACIYETQRFADIVPLSVPHIATADTTLKGSFIPKGTMILPNLNSIHLDRKIWPEPHIFKPDRFLDNQGKMTNKSTDYILAFGIGKRECLGRDLAKMELFLYFTSIMKHFKFSVAPGYPAPDTEGDLGNVIVPKPFHVMIQTRC